MSVEDLRQSPMMGHLLDALDKGEDIATTAVWSSP
jgi:hypothetical protein